MNKLKCFLFGHKYVVTRKIYSAVRELRCTRCEKDFGMNDNVGCIIPLDDELRQQHDDLLKSNPLSK